MNAFLRRRPIVDAATQGDRARDRQLWGEAEQAYQAALGGNADRPEIWIQLGHALKEQGKIKHAIAAYLEAIKRDDTSSDAYLQLGHAYKVSSGTPCSRNTSSFLPTSPMLA